MNRGSDVAVLRKVDAASTCLVLYFLGFMNHSPNVKGAKSDCCIRTVVFIA